MSANALASHGAGLGGLRISLNRWNKAGKQVTPGVLAERQHQALRLLCIPPTNPLQNYELETLIST